VSAAAYVTAYYHMTCRSSVSSAYASVNWNSVSSLRHLTHEKKFRDWHESHIIALTVKCGDDWRVDEFMKGYGETISLNTFNFKTGDGE